MSTQTPPTPPIPSAPAISPYTYFVAGEGIVEASSEDILIGTPFSEIVEAVFVAAGDTVKKGTPLFRLNTETVRKHLDEALSNLQIAEAEYQKQLDLPRPESVPPYESRMKQAEAAFINHWKQYELVEKLENPKAVSRDEYNQRKYSALASKYELEEAEEDLCLLLSGAWVRDLEIYRAEVKKARTQVAIIESEIERSTVRAPIDGCVFRVNTRPGQIAVASELQDPLMIFGSIDPLHIRVDIDEDQAWRIARGAPGTAFVRGNSTLNVPLKFVRLEPFLVPKHSLTGDTTEQVDMRVLQVIYEFDGEGLPIYPGMVMDVFVETEGNETYSDSCSPCDGV